MGVGQCLPVRNPKTGEKTVFESGSWFCYDCNKLLKTIHHPHKGTIEPCKCGCNTVFRTE